jgi:copper binding plastocyanin/azurin family protein
VSPRTQRVIVALSTAAVGAFLLAACVSANQPAAQPNPTFSSDVSATPGMSGMGSMPIVSAMPMTPAQNGAPPVGPVGPNAVSIDGFAFAPNTLTVKAGSTVTWTNKDEDPHTVVASGGAFRSQVLGSG